MIEDYGYDRIYDAMKCFRERYAGACYSDGYEVMLMPNANKGDRINRTQSFLLYYGTLKTNKSLLTNFILNFK